MRMFNADIGDTWCWQDFWARKRTMMRDPVAGITGGVKWADEPHPDLSTGRRTVSMASKKKRGFSMEAFVYLRLYNTFFQSSLWWGEEDVLSEADPPPNYHFLFTSPWHNYGSEKRLKERFYVLREICIFPGMRLFLFSCSTLRTLLTKAAMRKGQLIINLSLIYIVSQFMPYFPVPYIATTTEDNKHFFWTCNLCVIASTMIISV